MKTGNSLRTLLLVVLTVMALAGCAVHADRVGQPSEVEPGPRNIIFFIADGAGSSHFTVMDMITEQSSSLGRFSHTGMVLTHSGDRIVTDSGASASAFATGYKAKNRAVSVGMDGQNKTTALEIAEDRGFATGLATTSVFFDATLAAFAAHSPSRYEHVTIIDQMMRSGVDLVISNGLASLGEDERPTLEEIASAHDVITASTASAIREAPDGRLIGVLPSFGTNDLDNPEFPLPDITSFAIDRLGEQSDKFFVVIETEATDTASHRNNTEDVLAGLRSLNEAINTALDFAEEDGETLVLVTGDHETGDLQIAENRESPDLELVWGTTMHTGQALPIFAYGPGAESFTGWIDNTVVGQRLIELVSQVRSSY